MKVIDEADKNAATSDHRRKLKILPVAHNVFTLAGIARRPN
ncbi:hypothetical protein [Aliirhizobium cellulosilyticum]|uniref:Uncharacterized protein n=1 Tax=Aliirhizobium cellulosilyticum TaxID=393664 RepID=A0A7W6WSQ7_9HYPH|nr:hypothetical protein [Rhizobium cellulosilyticum]MBB4351425.1 hypothetical protein [Rhizobium cellulosilyticum]MBB4414618.1 hypothetical protein [Rhizobium cellulosilyticum]MBB4449234.1 hypothetical protein [Rhizobium cellulosilyticum]